MSWPARRTSPASAAEGTISCIRLRIRRNVDFPQPDGPISAVIVPACIASETRSSTLFWPNQAETCRASSIGTVPVAGQVSGTAVTAVIPWSTSVSSQDVGEQAGGVLVDVPQDGEEDRGTGEVGLPAPPPGARPRDRQRRGGQGQGPQRQRDQAVAVPGHQRLAVRRPGQPA